MVYPAVAATAAGLAVVAVPTATALAVVTVVAPAVYALDRRSAGWSGHGCLSGSLGFHRAHTP